MRREADRIKGRLRMHVYCGTGLPSSARKQPISAAYRMVCNQSRIALMGMTARDMVMARRGERVPRRKAVEASWRRRRCLNEAAGRALRLAAA